MFAKTRFYRAIAVPVCVAWGIIELVALQRAHWQRLRTPSTRIPH